MKTLFFEGAGCVPRGDVENCRIRTAFTNDDGKKIYLELSGMEVTKHTPDRLKNFQNVGFVDHCHYITDEKPNDDCNKYKLTIERRTHFEYSKQGILDFVNSQLDCSFDQIIVTDIFDWYLVHNYGSYNFMEDFNYNPEKAEKARKAFHDIDMRIRNQLNEKYSKISLHSIGDHDITVRFYASNESMSAHGLDPDKRFMTIPID